MRSDGRFQGTMPSRMILLPTVVAVSVAASACGIEADGTQTETFGVDQAQYASICTDLRDVNNPNDDVRVDDDRCGEDDEDGNASNRGFSFIWIDLGSGHNHSVPAHGQPIPKGLGSNTHPRGAVVMKKLPSHSFTTSAIKSGAIKPASPIQRVQRGGLGVTGKGGTSGG